MKDLETRLRDSLAERAESAPRPPALATRARARLRRRRTAIARLVAGILAAVVVSVAVPVVVAASDDLASSANGALDLLGDDAGGSTPVVEHTPFIVPDLSPDLAPTVRTARESLRQTTWLGLRFVVPSTWKDGATTAWCAKGNGRVRAKDPARVVARIDLPDGARPQTVCAPTRGYGVTVSANDDFEPSHPLSLVWQYDAEASGDGPADYPDGAWLSTWYDDDWVVTVATPDPGLTTRVVRSVASNDIDVNGCALVFDESDLRSAVGPRGVGAALCSYTSAGLLEDSERLTEPETTAALSALAGAPTSYGASHCQQEQGWLVSLTPAGESAHLARYETAGLGSCQDGVEAMGAAGSDFVAITTDVVEALALDKLAGE